MAVDEAVLAQLNAASEGYRDPLAVLPWERLSLKDWWLPPACISLAGLPEFERLPEATRRRLSHYEFLHFLHVGLWLEGLFIARLAAGLSRPASLAVHAGHLHMIREEAGHSLMFVKLMEVSGLFLPARAFRPPRLLDLLGRRAPPDSLLFRLAVVIGEEVPDKFNRRIHVGAGEINPLVALLCRLHRRDEARHIARARQALDEDVRAVGKLARQGLRLVLRPLLGQFARTVFLPAPEVYELAGLAPGRRWRRLAAANPARRAFMEACVTPTRNWLARQGLLPDV